MQYKKNNDEHDNKLKLTRKKLLQEKLRSATLKGYKVGSLSSPIGLLWRSCFRWVGKLIPSFNPSDHGICKLDEVGINSTKLLLHLLGEFNVAFLDRGAFLWEGGTLEKGNDLFLPEDAFVLLFQIHKWVACFAVPYVWKASLHSQPQMITDNLQIHMLEIVFWDMTLF